MITRKKASTEFEIKQCKLPALQTKMSEVQYKLCDIPEIKNLSEIKQELDLLEDRLEKFEVFSTYFFISKYTK